MSIDYKIYVQATEPEDVLYGTLWLIKATGLLLLKIDEFRHFASAEGSLTIGDGIYELSEIQGSSPPGSPAIGQIWIQDNLTAWIYLDNWIPFAGA